MKTQTVTALSPPVKTSGLTKRYGARTVVDSLDIEVPHGAVAGFVGPNGAGKTTTLRMLLGLVRPSAGHGQILGRPLTEPQRYLARVGALIESPAFYPGLSGERNLAVLATLGGVSGGPTTGRPARGGDELVLGAEAPGDFPRLQALLTRRGLPASRVGDRLRVGLGDLVAAGDEDGVATVVAGINRAAAAEGLALVELSVQRRSLEESFLTLLGGAR